MFYDEGVEVVVGFFVGVVVGDEVVEGDVVVDDYVVEYCFYYFVVDVFEVDVYVVGGGGFELLFEVGGFVVDGGVEVEFVD